MSTHADRRPPHPDHGQPAYLQVPCLDLARSAAFYEAVLGWRVEQDFGSFEAPGLIGQLTTDLAPATSGGPVLWYGVDDQWRALRSVVDHGGTVLAPPQEDQGARWLVEVADPAGNRLGLVAPRRTARAQPMLVVRDVERSSRWYQQLLGLTSDHGGPEYERLLADGVLTLQLHRDDVAHDHGRLIDDEPGARGKGTVVWFGEVSAFDEVVGRARDLGARVVREPHRNPPAEDGNGPSHRELWLEDPDGYTVVVASPDGEAWVQPVVVTR